MFFPNDRIMSGPIEPVLSLKVSRTVWEQCLSNNVNGTSSTNLSDDYTSDGGSESFSEVRSGIPVLGHGHGNEVPPMAKRGRRSIAVNDVIQVCDAYVHQLPSVLLDKPPPPTSSSGPFSKFTCRDIIKHCVALRVDNIYRQILPFLQKLMHHPRNLNNFNQPVDPVALEIPDYFTKIKKPMDLGTVKSLVRGGKFRSLGEVYSAICLVFDNAMTYNHSSNSVHEAAKIMKREFQADFFSSIEKHALQEKKFTHYCAGCFGAVCIMCGEKCLKLESALIVCSGSCGQRIKRHSVYFVSKDGTSHWCQKCYSSLPHMIESRTGPLILKKDLLRRKSEEDRVEQFRTCSICGCQVHEICALLMSNICHEDQGSPFRCSYCTLCAVKALSNSLGQLEQCTEIETPHSSSSSSMSSSSSPLSSISPRTSNLLSCSVTASDELSENRCIDLPKSSIHVKDESRENRTQMETSDTADTTLKAVLDGGVREHEGHQQEKDEVLNYCNLATNQGGPWRAKDLLRTKLSDFLEAMVTERLNVTGFPGEKYPVQLVFFHVFYYQINCNPMSAYAY